MKLDSNQLKTLRDALSSCSYMQDQDARRQIKKDLQTDYPGLRFVSRADDYLDIAGTIDSCLAFGGTDCFEKLLQILEGFEGSGAGTMKAVWAAWKEIRAQRSVPVPPKPSGPGTISGQDVTYDLAAIRKLLSAAFTPQDLRRFCEDRTVFRPIVNRFGPGYGLDDMIDEALTYCEKRLLFDKLLDEVQADNPGQYARYEPYQIAT